MLQKEQYTSFSNQRKDLPLFLYPWWLEAAMAGEGDWDVILIKEDEEIKAVLPYCYKKRLGITNLFIPWCTAYLSTFPADSAHTGMLLQQLPAAADYRFRLFPQADDKVWVASGFVSSLSPTHILRDISPETFSSGITEATFRQIRKAEKIVSVNLSDDYIPAYALWADNMHRKKAMTSLVPEHNMKSIDKALSERSQREVWEARDVSGNLHAAIYLAIDSRNTYYLWGGYDQAYKSSGATSLLFYHAIIRTLNAGRQFDFEGSRIPGVARFYKGFGAQEIPVYSVHKSPSLLGKLWKRGK